jgi:hypothetical protein
MRRQIAEIPDDELALYTSERHTLYSLARETGRRPEDFWASDLTAFRAAALIEGLASDIAHETAERKRKAKEKRFGRKRH